MLEIVDTLIKLVLTEDGKVGSEIMAIKDRTAYNDEKADLVPTIVLPHSRDPAYDIKRAEQEMVSQRNELHNGNAFTSENLGRHMPYFRHPSFGKNSAQNYLFHCFVEVSARVEDKEEPIDLVTVPVLDLSFRLFTSAFMALFDFQAGDVDVGDVDHNALLNDISDAARQKFQLPDIFELVNTEHNCIVRDQKGLESAFGVFQAQDSSATFHFTLRGHFYVPEGRNVGFVPHEAVRIVPVLADEDGEKVTCRWIRTWVWRRATVLGGCIQDKGQRVMSKVFVDLAREQG
ncbi:hypothetical protein LTR65_008141 [Meristemomyces frigidus]